MKRLFIAIPFQTEDHFRKEWNAIKNLLSIDNIKWIPEENLHITLKFLGETADEQIPDICEIIDHTFKNQKSELIHWNKIGIFGSHYKPRVIWLGCKEEDLLRNMYDRLKTNLESAGFEYDRQNFVPHISLARLKKPVDKYRISQITEKYHNFELQTQLIKEVVLMESILKPNGAEYQILHCSNFS
ncbi:MAG: RNA 2',3'-cyclic phosphodiesterase [Marinilabiliales bacterium]|nr:MAG: RNA 2',3'-cyclic phosphodiesterase [Marinilabiliales bacterium]